MIEHSVNKPFIGESTEIAREKTSKKSVYTKFFFKEM